jgi:hypothetical protein
VNIKIQETIPVKIIQKDAETERISTSQIATHREEASATLKTEAKITNDENNFNIPQKQNRDEVKEQEPNKVNNITSAIKENRTETSVNPINQSQQNFYDEMEKEFKYNKAFDDPRETNSITENLREKLNARYTSPRNDTRSNYTNLRLRNYLGNMESKEPSISSFRDRYKAFGESKASLETNIELANKKCEIYEKEITQLRQLVHEMKLQMSKTNEEAHKLEISRLKQNLSMKDKENQILSRENLSLKKQIKKYEDNKTFRIEAEKKFSNYNKEIENLIYKINELSTLKSQDREIKKTDERRCFETEKKEIQLLNTHSLEITDSIYNNQIHDNANKINFPLNNNFINTEKNTEQNVEDKSNEINQNRNSYQVVNYNNYDYNEFTNGNPNIIEELGADNYLNMNGNTYDEMKDIRYEDDNLQDHQYYDNTVNLQRSVDLNNNYNQVFEPAEADIQLYNKNANTGDNFNNTNNVNLRSTLNNNKAESGATNNILNRNRFIFNLLNFLEPGEEKEEEENVFSNYNNEVHIFDSMNNSMNSEKQKSIAHSKTNSIFNQSGTIKAEYSKPSKLNENKSSPNNINKPMITVPTLKKENKQTLPPQPIKPVVKQPLINKIENANRFDSLFDDQTNDNAEINIFNAKPVNKISPTNTVNKPKPQNVNLNKMGHMNVPNKVNLILLN